MYNTWGLSLKTPKQRGVFWFQYFTTQISQNMGLWNVVEKVFIVTEPVTVVTGTKENIANSSGLETDVKENILTILDLGPCSEVSATATTGHPVKNNVDNIYSHNQVN